MTTNSFVAVVPQQHNTRGNTRAQGASEQSGGAGDWLTAMLCTACAWLLIVEVLLIVVRQIEIWFGILSGFWLLIGPFPTTLLMLAIAFGGAAYITSVTHMGLWMHRALWWLRFGWRRPAATATVEATTPQWRVRTTPRTRRTRGAASRRVMDMEV